MFALAYENSKSNIKNLKYIADTYDDLATIPAEELSFGALCKVIETGDIYKLNSDGEWIRQLNGQGSGLPVINQQDVGKVLTVIQTNEDIGQIIVSEQTISTSGSEIIGANCSLFLEGTEVKAVINGEEYFSIIESNHEDYMYVDFLLNDSDVSFEGPIHTSNPDTVDKLYYYGEDGDVVSLSVVEKKIIWDKANSSINNLYDAIYKITPVPNASRTYSGEVISGSYNTLLNKIQNEEPVFICAIFCNYGEVHGQDTLTGYEVLSCLFTSWDSYEMPSGTDIHSFFPFPLAASASWGGLAFNNIPLLDCTLNLAGLAVNLIDIEHLTT